MDAQTEVTAESAVDVEVKEKWRWKAFWRRLRTRTLTTADHDALTCRVWLPFMLVPSVLWALTLDTEYATGDWALAMARWWLFPFFLGVTGVLSYCTMPPNPSVYRKAWGVVAAVVGSLVMAYSGASYFSFLDAFTGGKEQIAVYGPVLARGYSTGRTGFNASITIRYEGRRVQLSVSADDYNKYRVGLDDYGRMMYRGGSGYFYRWADWVPWKPT